MWSLWMPSWLQSWLSYLGLFNKRGRLVRTKKPFSINLNPSQAFLGLDNAGKTSLVQMLSTGVIHQVFFTNFPKLAIKPKTNKISTWKSWEENVHFEILRMLQPCTQPPTRQVALRLLSNLNETNLNLLFGEANFKFSPRKVFIFKYLHRTGENSRGCFCNCWPWRAQTGNLSRAQSCLIVGNICIY